MALYNDGNYPLTDIKIQFADYLSFREHSEVREHSEASFEKWVRDGETYKRNLQISSLASKARVNNIYTFTIHHSNQHVFHLDFNVFWKDGSYTCEGWFKNPTKELPNNFPKEDIKLLDYLNYSDNKGSHFIPRRYQKY